MRRALNTGAIAEDSSASGIDVNNFQGDNSQVSSGAVYIFSRTGATWTQQVYIKAANSGANAVDNHVIWARYKDEPLLL